jgi:hypothetical protein
MLPPDGQYRLETTRFDGDASYLFKALGADNVTVDGNATLGYQGGEMTDVGLSISVHSTPASTMFIRVSLHTCNNGVFDGVCFRCKA